MNLLKAFFLLAFLCICLHVLGQQKQEDTSGIKRNIISIVQFQFTENGIGFGTSYERLLGKSGIFSFYVPAMVTFDVANTSRIYDYNTGNYNTGRADAMFYAMPGIKYCPFGARYRIHYATGASIVIGAGQRSGYVSDLYGLNETEQVQAHFLTGLMWQNSCTTALSTHLCIGAELGIGSSIINRVGDANVKNEFLIQGSFKIGYRF